MRFLWAAMVAAALLGSVALCQYHVTRTVEVRLARDLREAPAGRPEEGLYTLVLTPGFSMGEADPFALRDEGPSGVRLRISTARGVLFDLAGPAAAGDPITVPQAALPGARAELFVEALPQSADALKSLPLRVQVFKQGAVCDDVTLWTEGGGARLERRVEVSLEPRRAILDRGLRGEETGP